MRSATSARGSAEWPQVSRRSCFRLGRAVLCDPLRPHDRLQLCDHGCHLSSDTCAVIIMGKSYMHVLRFVANRLGTTMRHVGATKLPEG